MSDINKWTREEQEWWQDHYKQQLANNQFVYKGSPLRPQGLRHYYREMLFRHVRSDIQDKIWIDIGAGNSYTITDLIHPDKYKYHYVAADISSEGLKIGKENIGQTPVLCDSLFLPFKTACAYVVSGFGILHHIPNWKQALHMMIDLLQPGGYLLLFEAITKPRIFGQWRRESYTAKIDSPHEGDINDTELNSDILENCDILIWDYSGSASGFWASLVLNVGQALSAKLYRYLYSCFFR